MSTWEKLYNTWAEQETWEDSAGDIARRAFKTAFDLGKSHTHDTKKDQNYNRGYTDGHRHGYETGYDVAKQEIRDASF